MSIAIAIWSTVVEAGEPVEITPPADVHVTNIALGAELADASGRTTVKLVYFGPAAGAPSDDEDEDDEEEHEEDAEPIATVLCSLTPGKIEHAKVDLVLSANETYVIDTVGKNTVYLSGNYIDQSPSDLPPDEDELLDEDDEDEEAFRLEDVSSDVEVEVDEMEDDDEEAPELLSPPSPPKKKAQASEQPSKKRAREEDADAETAQLSKKQLKKLNKKLKAEGGNAVPAGQPAQQQQKPKQPEAKKPVEQKGGESKQDGEGKKKKKKNKGDKAKL